MRSQFDSSEITGPMGSIGQPQMGGYMQMPNQMAGGPLNNNNGMAVPLQPGMPGMNLDITPGITHQLMSPMASPHYGINAPPSQIHMQPLQQIPHQPVQPQVVSQPEIQVPQQTPPANPTPTTSAKTTPNIPVPLATPQSKEFNTVSLCRFGQETVQDIVSRTQEVFSSLKSIQPPNGTLNGLNANTEKKVKVQEQLRTIRLLFKRLRLIYEKCNESCQTQGMEYTHIESLISYKDDIDVKADEKTKSEGFRASNEEYKELQEQVTNKNRQLKEVSNHLRRIIWEINTMLNMRKS